MTEETIANLNRLLKIEQDTAATQAAKIEELERKVEDLDRYIDTDVLGWTRHRPWSEDGLPVPRLEMRWSRSGPAEAVALLVLVYRHFLDQIEAVPLGQTRCSGGGYRDDRPADAPPMFHEWPERGGGLELPFRDGAHLKHNAKHLGLRAFISTDLGDVTEIDPVTKAQTWIRRAGVSP
jgi:hypothetical protein